MRRFTAAGIIGTLLLFLVVAACVRLGLWQLDRLAQRRELNATIEQRRELSPLHSLSAVLDTAHSLYRTATFPGEYDVTRSIVLPGRSLRGVPGVHLLTPFRISADSAVLVNRGWVPAADAATIPLDSFPTVERTALGIVLPFPGAAQSLAPRQPAADSFRTVWYSVDPAALRAQFPYTLLPVQLQLLPRPGAAQYPRQLPPPALDEGPHLSYAIQWFAFALIGTIGWVALLLRSRRPQRTAPPVPLLLLALLLAPSAVRAQTRPLEPLDWRIIDASTNLVVGVGANVLWQQPLPLAGSSGTLTELPTWSILWRSGRVGLELTGAAVWRLREDTVTRGPVAGVDVDPDGVREDAGPVQVGTLVRLTPERWPADLVLRFGTRIPTTSDETGLERDRTDFYALASGRLRWRTLSLAGETGVGINGARSEEYPQNDVWAYTLEVQHAGPQYALFAALAGHQDGHTWIPPVGNEDRSELRAGIRLGRRWWLRTTYVHGVHGPSPEHGLLLSAGVALGCRTDCLPFQ